jgi:molecular chaperone GrpE
MNKEKNHNNNKSDKEIEEVLQLSREEKLNEESLLQQSIEEKNKIISDLETKNKELYKQLLTLKADFDNYRKRVEKEKQQKFLLGKIYVFEKIISLYEIFSQAIKSIENIEKVDKQTLEGIKLIYQDFKTFLEKEGVTKIDSVGKIFNPLHHEILEFEDNNDLENNTVIEVLIDGYKLKTSDEEIILRPAKVKVSRKTVETVGDKDNSEEEQKSLENKETKTKD